MKHCLYCNKEFQEKKETAKYCSVSCRVMFNRKHPQERVTKTQMQVLYNATLELVGRIPFAPTQEVYDAPKMPDRVADEPLLYKPTPKVAAEAIMRSYVEERRDASCEEEYFTWLKKLEDEPRLTSKQKELVKSTT